MFETSVEHICCEIISAHYLESREVVRYRDCYEC